MERVFKVVLVGGTASGKTSLRNFLLHRTYTWQHTPTNNPDFVSTSVALNNGELAAVQIWDTADLLTTNSLVQDADGIILVIDGTRRESLLLLEQLWSALAADSSGPRSISMVPVILARTKVDMHQNIDCVQAKEYCRSVLGIDNIVCIPASARTGEGIATLFQTIVEQCQMQAQAACAPEQDKLILDSRPSRHGDPIAYHRFDVDEGPNGKRKYRINSSRFRYTIRRLLCLT
ncbi:GTP binding [Coemansia guatemalensis]|uniref:GTP binding n=1 Tax=Coemansia guatemalensis TaxID=2761395 RepID=A0A9W8HR02_9FUNG|nr:GTP binding [Coemansia guatemalensis]